MKRKPGPKTNEEKALELIKDKVRLDWIEKRGGIVLDYNRGDGWGVFDLSDKLIAEGDSARSAIDAAIEIGNRIIKS